MNDERHWAENEEIVEEYVLGRVKGPLRARLVEHLDSCVQCRTRVRNEVDFAHSVRMFAAARTKEELQELIKGTERSIPWPHVMSIAAALFLIVGIGFYNRWFLRPIPQSPPLETVGKQKINGDKGTSQLSDADVPSGQTLEGTDAAARHDKKSEDALAARKEPTVPTSEPVTTRSNEKDQMEKTRPHMLTGFLLHEPVGQFGKAPEQEGSGADAIMLKEQDRIRASTHSVVKRTGNLVIHLVDEMESHVLPGQVRCSIEQVDTLFHLAVFLDPELRTEDPTEVLANLVAPDSLILLLGQSRIGLELPVEFRGQVLPGH